jgi:putative tryptophan/tyrosine transport system substrate-binding protein
MKRREFIVCVIAAGWSLSARAQQFVKVSRIGFLGNSNATLESNLVGAFRDALRDLGYEEGRNILLEYRWAEGDYARFPRLIGELIGLNVDVIVTAGTPAALAVKKATTTIPCVMVAVGDPVGTDLVASLARPGRNMTGLTSIAPELEGKRLELLREVVPSVSSVAVMWNPANAYMHETMKEVDAAAAKLQIKVLSLQVRTVEELEQSFATIGAERPNALNVLADRLFLHNRGRLVDFAAQHRLPGVHAYRELVEAGGLMSYGPNYADMHRRAAWYVDKILHGAVASELPVERPAKFELVVNTKTAKALGLDVPPTLLARADEVIE